MVSFSQMNKLFFTKTGACKICCIQDDWYSCDARKYTAFVNDKKTCLFHYENHFCDAKLTPTRPTDLVQKTVSADPNTRLAEIQSNAMLSDLRDKKGWEEVKKAVN